MAYKVKVSHPALPRDQEIEIAGLGLIKNGGSATVTAEQEATFQSIHGESLQDALKDNKMFTVEGSSELKAGADK